MYSDFSNGHTNVTHKRTTDDATSCSPVLLLTREQAAQVLGISPRKVWGMTASGEIPHIKLGRCVRYPLERLQRWVAERTTGGGASGSN